MSSAELIPGFWLFLASALLGLGLGCLAWPRRLWLMLLAIGFTNLGVAGIVTGYMIRSTYT